MPLKSNTLQFTVHWTVRSSAVTYAANTVWLSVTEPSGTQAFLKTKDRALISLTTVHQFMDLQIPTTLLSSYGIAEEDP